MVDGVIELSDTLVGPRAVRELTVHKFRGGDYLRGKHEVEITDDGIVIHPRTEIQFDKPPGQATEERDPDGRSGSTELDRMLFGGLPSGSTTALLGAPGAGKTHARASRSSSRGRGRASRGSTSASTSRRRGCMEKAGQVGIELEKYVEEGLIEIDLAAAAGAHARLAGRAAPGEDPRRASSRGGGCSSTASRASAPRRSTPTGCRGSSRPSCNQLRTLDVTAVVSEELALFRPEIDMPNPELANVVETVILLRYVELRSQLYRLISIMKMRESRYDTSIREFRITDDGLEVAASFESAEAILTGHARPDGPGPEGNGGPAMKTILVVDDEFDLAGTLRAILEGEGYPPRPASTAGRPSRRLRSVKPDLLLMDVMMPRLSGYEVARIVGKTRGWTACRWC